MKFGQRIWQIWERAFSAQTTLMELTAFAHGVNRIGSDTTFRPGVGRKVTPH